MISRKDIDVNFQHNLVEIIPERKEAIFEVLKEGHQGERKTFSVSVIDLLPIISNISILLFISMILCMPLLQWVHWM